MRKMDRKVKSELKKPAFSVYHTGMQPVSKKKVEVLLVEAIESQFKALCDGKGISYAEGLRRAIEAWIRVESK